jgi:hypothetical protein
MPEHTDGRQRAVLPIPDRNHVGVTTYDADGTKVGEGRVGLGEDAEDADHLIIPDERLKIAMARQ